MTPTTPLTISASGSLVDNMFAYIHRVDDELKVVLLYKNNTTWSAKSCGVQDCLFDSSAGWDSWKDEDFPEGLISSDEGSFQSAIRKSFESSSIHRMLFVSKPCSLFFGNCPIIT